MRALFEAARRSPGVIVEPIVQGAGGMRFHPPRMRPAPARPVRRARDPAVLDEIATGFGRTGTLFAAAELADILCLGKALTGGYMTLAATLCTAATRGAHRRAADARADVHGQPAGDRRRAGVNRVCSKTARGEADVARIERGLQGCRRRGAPGVKDVRVKGAIGVIELDHPIDGVAATAGGGRARRLAAPVPRPDLHDAAVRHRRRGHRAHQRAAMRERRRMRIVVTGTDTGVGKTYVSAALRDRGAAYVKAAQTGDDDDAATVRELSGADGRTRSRATPSRSRPRALGRARRRAAASRRKQIADFVRDAAARPRDHRGRRRAARALRRRGRDDRRRRRSCWTRR